MAKVEYIQVKFFSTNGYASSSGWNYTGTMVDRGTAVIPLIKCSRPQLESMFGTLPNDDQWHEVSLQYNSDFISKLGLDLTTIVTCGIVDTLDHFTAIMTQYGNLLPSVTVKDTGNGYNSNADAGKLHGIFIEYNTIPTGTIAGHGGTENLCLGTDRRVAPRTVDNTFYNNGGNYTTQNMGVAGVPIGIGYAQAYNNNEFLVQSCLNFQVDDDYIYTYWLLITNIRSRPYISRCPIAWSGNPGRYKYDSLAYLIAKSDKTILRYDLTVVNGTGGGQYASGESVTIVAQPPNEGDIFAHWEFSYEVDIQYGGLNTAAVSFLMPNRGVTVTAVFISSGSDTYSLTVQNGSGTGVYAENADVTIVANRRENLIFAHWDVSVVGTVDSDFSINWTYGGTNTASASFKMPAKNLVIYAAYVNDSGNFPYAGGGASTPSGGGGSWTTPDNNVSPPGLPNASTSAVNAGMVTMYSPTLSELQALGDFLWSDNFISDFADNVKKLLTNPMDCIISLHVVPYPAPTVSEAQEVRFGMIGSGVNMKRITTQYVSHDCGSIDIPNFSGSFLDYTPHTKYSLFLPFIGSVQLDADEITGKSLNVKYHIDLLTGACVAFVSADSVLIASYNGQCSNPIPVSGANYSRLIASIIGVIGSAAIAGLTMGASAAVAAGAASTAAGARAVSATNSVSRLASAFNETGHWGKGLPGVADVRTQLRDAMATANSVANAPAEQAINTTRSSANRLIIAHTVTSTVNNVMGSKGQVQHSGSMGGSVGFLGKRTPYLTITRPRQSIPNNYGHFYGYPSNISGTLASFSGYTVFDVMEATSITGTDGEMDELIELLKGGVYL